METKEYVVTKRAGPKVAGVAAKADDVLKLTPLQAESELLAGAIVPKGKESGEDPFKRSGKLAGIQARARGEDDDTDEAIEMVAPTPDDPPPPPAIDPAGTKPASRKAGAAGGQA